MFGWFKSKKKKKQTEVLSDGGTVLHSHDLTEWNYLGFMTLILNEEEHPTFLFVSKNDFSKRSYIIKGFNADVVKKYHNYVSKYLDPWTLGEKPFNTYVANPSEYLVAYMLDNHGVVWDKDNFKWKSTENSKHHRAKIKQYQEQKEAPPTGGSGVQKDPVVIQVDFRKK